MALKEMNTQLQYRKFALWDEGDFIHGIFKRIREAGEYKGKMQYNAVIELLKDAQFEDYKGNEIKAGANFGLAISTSLQEYFCEENIGNEFLVEYLGKKKSKSGEEYHSFKVMMDDGTDDDNGIDEDL